MEKNEKKYYHRINNLDIELCETNHKYIMIHEWSVDNSHRWGLASFIFGPQVDWYDFGALVDLGYKWIIEGCFTADDERYYKLDYE